MSILNSLPKKIGVATENANGLMSSEDKIAVNKINRIEADVADKMHKDAKIKSSQLDTSNDTVKIQPNNLSDAVKKMMTGESTVSPTIGLKSLVTDYYADKSVTFDKRTAVGSIAVIVSSDFCNFNTTGDTEAILSIPKSYTVYYGNKQKVVNDAQESLVLQKDEVSVITYNELEGFTVYNESAIKEQDFIVGAFDGKNVTMFNGRYTVNDSVIAGDESIDGSSIKDFSLDSRKLAIQHGLILSDVLDAPYINVNFVSKFIEVVNPFDANIADQYVMHIDKSQECRIPDNTTNNKYLYIYYDLGISKLNALWASVDITKTILNNNEKLVLLAIIYNQEKAVGFNEKCISVNSISIKNKAIEYTNILSGQIVVDFSNKKIEATEVKTFIDDKLVNLLESDSQTILLTDEIINNINRGISYTIAAVRFDFNTDKYRLVFDKTENIKSIGLDAIVLSSIKNYTLSHNRDNIMIVKENGDIIKSTNIITLGDILPMDDETVVVKLSTELEDGVLTLVSTTVPGTSIIDAMSNTRYDIDSELKSQMIVESLHGVYSVLFNTETEKIEIIPQTNAINNKVYISLGFVQELSDPLSYIALGNITNHITLNSKRPTNYTPLSGPDPDKGYDWVSNRLVLPKDIYLLSNTNYSLYCQNMSMNKYVDNDFINYEIALPNTAITTENELHINVPVEGVFDTMVAGKFKGNNSCLFKDVTLHFSKPEEKELTVLCIGDDTVDMNMPSYIKRYLTSYGYTPIMLGTVQNNININGYGLRDLKDEYGEGHRGWRMTDFMCTTKRNNGTIYTIESNPFMNKSKFDFTHYMTTNAYDNVDVVVVSVGLNDITGYHIASTTEDIQDLSMAQNLEKLPLLYKEMITSIHAYDSNIKIIINPTMIKGIDDDYNTKSLSLTEVLVQELSSIRNVFFVPGYLSQPLFAGANSSSISTYPVSSDINDTKLGSQVSTSDINGMAQSNLAFMITSTIISVTK